MIRIFFFYVTFHVTVEFFLFNTEGTISGLVAESVGAIIVNFVDLLDDGHRCSCGLGFGFYSIWNNSSLRKSGDGTNGQSQNLTRKKNNVQKISI